MAYTIISQNNSTTTLSDGVNTITVPSRVNLTSGNFTIVEVNNNMATLEDGDGNVYRDIPCVATLAGEGGGGGAVSSVNGKTGTVVLNAADVSATPQYSSMPVATADDEDAIVQYTGATDANYTNGYFYENVGTTTSSSATASQTTGSSLSDVAVVLATFETQITTSGSYAFTSDGSDWSYDGNTVDLTDYGITYTGTPVADDVITVVYTESSTTYAWTRIDVQPSPNPLPSQTGQSGKFLTTDGTDASWSDKVVVDSGNKTVASSCYAIFNGTSSGPFGSIAVGGNATGTESVTVGGVSSGLRSTSVAGSATGSESTAVGVYANAYANYSTVIGKNSEVASGANYGIAIGRGAQVSANAVHAIQIGSQGTSYEVNSDANTVKIANANGNFEIMSADGTIPAARHASLPAADGTYTLQLVISSGVPTLSWVAV